MSSFLLAHTAQGGSSVAQSYWHLTVVLKATALTGDKLFGKYMWIAVVLFIWVLASLPIAILIGKVIYLANTPPKNSCHARLHGLAADQKNIDQRK